MLNSPKAVVLTEIWLKTILFPHRVSSSGGCVGKYLHDTVFYQVIEKSCNLNYTNNIDYRLITLSQFDVVICYKYCSP